MIATNLYWIDGPWSGRLALAARPRGGDWLSDEISLWRRCDIDTVVSLLTPSEEQDLDLANESRAATSEGMTFLSFPIPDRQVPSSEHEVTKFVEKMDTKLANGKNVVIHCRQGVGRSGLIAACLLIAKGWLPETAIQELSSARGLSIPETGEQREWIDHFAATLANSK
jgi:protein-tyrosine phosphatase